MTCRRRLRNGVVVLEDPEALPDTTELSLELIESKRKSGKPKKYRQRVMKYGQPGAGHNSGEYLYGHPER